MPFESAEQAKKPSVSAGRIPRREALKIAGVLLFAGLPSLPVGRQPKRAKRVVVAGAGIAGLSCAYELMKRGHDVTVLEASGRPGGHVRTLHDPFADGLYADMGAEHFYYPGYTEYWRYIQEFSLTPIPYPRRDRMVRFLNGERFTEEDLHSRKTLAGLGFNQQEQDFLARRPWAELLLLYLQQYVDDIRDELNPFTKSLRELDQLSVADLLQRHGA